MLTRDPPLRLALIITELEVGGAERCLVRLACGLDPSEFSCEVYSLAATPRGSRALVEELEAHDIPVHFLGGENSRGFWHVQRRLQMHWQAQPPDIVQSFLFHANVLAGITCPTGTPLVLGVRVADPRFWRSWIERRVAGRARPVVCVSEGVAQQLRVRGFSSAQLRVIPNGIQLDLYRDVSPADLTQDGIPSDRRLMLIVGRLDSQKGLDWLIQLAPRLLADHPSHDLAVAGDGPEKGRLLERIRRLGLESRIRLLGWRSDIPALLARSELMLLTSRYEGMPNVILEAMASGIPVVATRVEGVVELLGAGVEKQTVSFGDAPEMLARVRAFTDSPELRKQWGTNNLRRAADEFSLGEMVRRYAELYRNVAEAKRNWLT